MNIKDFNKGVSFSYKPEGQLEYFTLKDLYGMYPKDKVYTVRGLYINETDYGKQPLVVSEIGYINLPKHLVEQVTEIRGSEKLVDDINKCRVGFTIHEFFQSKFKKTCYGITWVDINEQLDFLEVDNKYIPF